MKQRSSLFVRKDRRLCLFFEEEIVIYLEIIWRPQSTLMNSLRCRESCKSLCVSLQSAPRLHCFQLMPFI